MKAPSISFGKSPMMAKCYWDVLHLLDFLIKKFQLKNPKIWTTPNWNSWMNWVNVLKLFSVIPQPVWKEIFRNLLSKFSAFFQGNPEWAPPLPNESFEDDQIKTIEHFKAERDRIQKWKLWRKFSASLNCLLRSA